MTFDYERALTILAENDVEIVVVGGIAAVLHGSPFVTFAEIERRHG